MSAKPTTYTIQGRTVQMPVCVRDASAGTALYAVPARDAQRLVPGDAFEVAEAAPGQAQLVLGMIDYRDNDLGDYNEVVVAVFARPRGAGPERTGTYIHALPVDQAFTREAGLRIWGFPKSVERIDIDYEEQRATCRLEMDGELAFRLSLPRARPEAPQTEELPQLGYSYVEGVPHVTRSRMVTRGNVVTPGGAGVALELGPHPLGQTLRELGLPKSPLLSTWSEHQSATFEAPEKL